jgi:hypothetical protein
VQQMFGYQNNNMTHLLEMTPHFCKQLGRNAKKVKMQNKVEVGHKND